MTSAETRADTSPLVLHTLSSLISLHLKMIFKTSRLEMTSHYFRDLIVFVRHIDVHDDLTCDHSDGGVDGGLSRPVNSLEETEEQLIKSNAIKCFIYLF